MGNRFREKTVEEGLDGDVAREALKDAVARRGKETTAKKSGNRRRRHEESENADRHAHEQVQTEKAETIEKKETNEKRNVEHEEEVKNAAKEPIPDEVEDNVVTPKLNSRGGRVAKGVAKVLGGDILADKLVLKQIPLLLLCLVFLLLLVANRYQVESLSRKKIAVEEKMNELREQQIQLQKENQNSIRISQIRDELKTEKNLGILPTPPNVI